MKPVNLTAGGLDVAWHLLYVLALDPSSPIYWPGLFTLDLCDKSGSNIQPSGLGSFTGHLFLKRSSCTDTCGTFPNIQC